MVTRGVLTDSISNIHLHFRYKCIYSAVLSSFLPGTQTGNWFPVYHEWVIEEPRKLTSLADVNGEGGHWALWTSTCGLRTAPRLPDVLIQILFAMFCDGTKGGGEALVTSLNTREKGKHQYPTVSRLATAIPEEDGQMAPFFSWIPAGPRPTTRGWAFMLFLPPTAMVSVFSLVFQHH